MVYNSIEHTALCCRWYNLNGYHQWLADGGDENQNDDNIKMS